MTKTTKAVLVVATLVALAYAGAAGVHATTDAGLSIAVQSEVFIDQGGRMIIRNDSPVEIRVAFSPSGGWTVEPESVVMAPDETTVIIVAGDGPDGATIEVRAGAATDAPEGAEPVNLVLMPRVYHEAPFDLGRFVGDLIPYGIVAGVLAWLLWRLKDVRISVTRTTR